MKLTPRTGIVAKARRLGTAARISSRRRIKRQWNVLRASSGQEGPGAVPVRDGCTWVEPRVEMQRILDSRPKFIVVEDGIFFRELAPEIKSLLTDTLAGNYRLKKHYAQHYMHHLYPFERFVMNGGAPADVYELVDPGVAKMAEPTYGSSQ
jgi:hypothetical protein